MRPVLRALIVLNALAILPTQAWANAEIVIAIRYLQAQGTSHSHLYLYREDGKLLRQLTNDNSGQDVAPIFDSERRNDCIHAGKAAQSGRVLDNQAARRRIEKARHRAAVVTSTVRRLRISQTSSLKPQIHLRPVVRRIQRVPLRIADADANL